MALTLEQYATYLDSRDLTWPAPPDVEAPKARPHLVRLSNVRAVTWSVYGTLLAISGGELLFEHPQQFVMDVALDKTIQEFNMWASMTRKPGKPTDVFRQLYTDLVREHSMAGAAKHPEVCADRVWETILKKLLQKDYKFDTGFFGALNEFSAKVAYFFHSSLQGMACYPGAADALRQLARRGVTQGLIADGQCFTLLQLQRGLKQQDASAEPDEWIDPELRAISHKVGARKPSEHLFRHVLHVLRERGITSDQVLHVGAHIAHDVVPAKRLGMRTALFAGDAASVQATPEQLKAPVSRPDALLTELPQILEVLPAS